jgi:hypothetical protein
VKAAEQTAESATTSSQPAGPLFGVAVIVPCYKEELTVAKVVADFTQALPGALARIIHERDGHVLGSPSPFPLPLRGRGNQNAPLSLGEGKGRG